MIAEMDTFNQVIKYEPKLEIAFGNKTMLLWMLAQIYEHHMETFKHLVRVGLMTELVWEAPPVLQKAGFLHDVGKVGINRVILNLPREFTAEEQAYVQTHVRIGSELVKPHDEEVAAVIAGHQESQDIPYPRKLPRQPINGAQAKTFDLQQKLTLVDTVDALRSPRVYKGPWTEDEVASALQERYPVDKIALALKAFKELARS